MRILSRLPVRLCLERALVFVLARRQHRKVRRSQSSAPFGARTSFIVNRTSLEAATNRLPIAVMIARELSPMRSVRPVCSSRRLVHRSSANSANKVAVNGSRFTRAMATLTPSSRACGSTPHLISRRTTAGPPGGRQPNACQREVSNPGTRLGCKSSRAAPRSIRPRTDSLWRTIQDRHLLGVILV